MKAKQFMVILFTLVIFAGVVAMVTLQLRQEIRQQMLGRDASIFYAVAQREASFARQSPLNLVLQMVDLKGVLGIRTYDMDGEALDALPDNLVASKLSPEVHSLLKQRQPWSHLDEAVILDTLFSDPFDELSDEPVPLLHVIVPLHTPLGETGFGHAEFLIDGQATIDDFVSLDHHLRTQSLFAFAIGSLIIGLVLFLSFRQLAQKNRALVRANQELTLHAKTAAIGAISANLFHGLKNAVFNLNLSLDEQFSGGTVDPATSRQAAARLQDMIQEVIEVIKDEKEGLSYSLSSEEIIHLVLDKVRPSAEEKGIPLEYLNGAKAEFSGYQGNLLLFVMENILRNAVEASPQGRPIVCRFSHGTEVCSFFIRDRGEGIPEHRQKNLFEPGLSGKAHGNGIGLSISNQLCRHMGGELRLVDTGPGGSEFEIRVPLTTGE
jgi:signal transduction histidine kinase